MENKEKYLLIAKVYLRVHKKSLTTKKQKYTLGVHRKNLNEKKNNISWGYKQNT